jgi:hypothetical protein
MQLFVGIIAGSIKAGKTNIDAVWTVLQNQHSSTYNIVQGRSSYTPDCQSIEYILLCVQFDLDEVL